MGSEVGVTGLLSSQNLRQMVCGSCTPRAYSLRPNHHLVVFYSPVVGGGLSAALALGIFLGRGIRRVF